MNRRILFIDYIYQRGHVNFNRIHIDALRSEGYDVKLVMHSDIAAQLGYPDSDYALKIPCFLKKRENRAVINRVIFVLTLLLLKLRIRFGKYSHVVVSECDEVTLGIMPPCRNMHIVCHDTATVQSRLKLHFLKRLARHNTFLVFDEYMKAPLVKNGITNVEIISHGCVQPFNPDGSVVLPQNAQAFRKLIFHPSSKADASFTNALVADSTLAGYLEANGILLLVHGNKPQTAAVSPNIRFIAGYIPTETYREIFLRADIVLLAYPRSFRNQVSGVSYECVANGKNMLVLEHPALHYCKDFYNYDPLFSDIPELVRKIRALTSSGEYRCTATRETLMPDYRKIFKQ